LGLQRLHDAVHGAPDLRFQVVGEVLEHLLALVRVVVVDRQRGAAGEPQELAVLDLDRRRERHEHALVVVRMVDDLEVVAALGGGGGREGDG